MLPQILYKIRVPVGIYKKLVRNSAKRIWNLRPGRSRQHPHELLFRPEHHWISEEQLASRLPPGRHRPYHSAGTEDEPFWATVRPGKPSAIYTENRGSLIVIAGTNRQSITAHLIRRIICFYRISFAVSVDFYFSIDLDGVLAVPWRRRSFCSMFVDRCSRQCSNLCALLTSWLWTALTDS